MMFSYSMTPVVTVIGAKHNLMNMFSGFTFYPVWSCVTQNNEQIVKSSISDSSNGISIDCQILLFPFLLFIIFLLVFFSWCSSVKLKFICSTW